MFVCLLILGDVCTMNCLVAYQANLAFGHVQVEAVIRDRPEMGPIINREPALRAMLDAGFAGELGGDRVIWVRSEPADNRPASHTPADSDTESPTVVQVSNKIKSSAIDKCMLLVFELYNLQSDRQFDALGIAAMDGRISRDTYATCCVRLEFLAIKKTQEFFRKHPLVDEHSQENVYYSAVVAYGGDFTEFLQYLGGLAPDKYNARRHFLEMYDKGMATRNSESSPDYQEKKSGQND